MKRVFQILAVGLAASVPACTNQTPVATGQDGEAPPKEIQSRAPTDQRGEALPKELTNSIGMKLVLIPAGEFQMGSQESPEELAKAFAADGAKPEYFQDERPPHRVRITKPFYLGVYEVTQAQYQKVAGSNPSSFKGESLPVETVSWDDAVAFCKRLSEVPEERAAGRAYRLPSEAEWEYACRARSTSRYSFGDAEGELGKHAWYRMNSGGTTHAVGEKQANAWGLYDMHGNVGEWCADRYGPYEAGAASDPTGPGSGSDRVCRGGGWVNEAGFCRSALRGRLSPVLRDYGLGFRVARSESGK